MNYAHLSYFHLQIFTFQATNKWQEITNVKGKNIFGFTNLHVTWSNNFFLFFKSKFVYGLISAFRFLTEVVWCDETTFRSDHFFISISKIEKLTCKAEHLMPKKKKGKTKHDRRDLNGKLQLKNGASIKAKKHFFFSSSVYQSNQIRFYSFKENICNAVR